MSSYNHLSVLTSTGKIFASNKNSRLDMSHSHIAYLDQICSIVRINCVRIQEVLWEGTWKAILRGSVPCCWYRTENHLRPAEEIQEDLRKLRPGSTCTLYLAKVILVTGCSHYHIVDIINVQPPKAEEDWTLWQLLPFLSCGNPAASVEVL